MWSVQVPLCGGAAVDVLLRRGRRMVWVALGSSAPLQGLLQIALRDLRRSGPYAYFALAPGVGAVREPIPTSCCVREHGFMSRKPSQVGTFASHLQHFARSVDIVDRDTLNTLQDLIFEYLRDEFDAKYLDLSIQQEVSGAPGLRTFWSSSRRDHSSPIKDPEGAYTSQTALCYDMKTPLWIVGLAQEPLRDAEGYKDIWSQVTDLPKYRSPINDRSLLTSVLIPIHRPNDRILGVMDVESSKYQDIADFDSEELVALADAWGVLIDLRDFNDIQTQGTRDAVKHLRSLKNSAGFPQIAKPQVFVAYSTRADNRVVGIIVEEIGRLPGPPKVVKWRDIEASGNITAQIDDVINTSRFGVCYLSEPTGQGTFQDNTNVLVEVGMFHEREVSQDQAICLLIRERNSPPSPFDIAHQRFLYVPRENGDLNIELLHAELESKLGWLMTQTH
jgi:hypothetical protein